MSIKDRLVEQGKKLTSSGPFVRLVSNDGVMRVATGLMDARGRLREAADHAAQAWDILLNGHALPTIDPALEGEPDVTGHKTKGAAKGAPAPASTSAPAPGGAAHAPARETTVGAKPEAGSADRSNTNVLPVAA